jgi:ribonuclease HI
VGLDEKSLLHSDLRLKLGSSNYFNLAHVRTLTDNPSWPDNWLRSSDLNLDGRWASEWNRFSTALKSVGISLTEEPDSLLWTGGDGSGLLTVKNLYEALFSHFRPESFSSWLHQIWCWKVPLKFKLFAWLAGKDKVLTWESLRRRGWEGPGICPLCRHTQEDIHHLLIHCDFSREVWRFLLTHLNLHTTWSGRTVSDCFINWLKNRFLPINLAAQVCWNLWIERNYALFEDRAPSPKAVIYRVLSLFSWQPSTVKPVLIKDIDLRLPEGFTLACFDGVALSTGLCCGAGGFFKTHQSRITKWFLNCGSGSNTKAELMGLWASLLLASSWSISHLLVRGDSSVIINWINKKTELHSVQIEGWKKKTLDLSQSFTILNCQHFPRSFNLEADALSKRALSELAGKLSIYHSENGIESPITVLDIF